MKWSLTNLKVPSVKKAKFKHSNCYREFQAGYVGRCELLVALFVNPSRGSIFYENHALSASLTGIDIEMRSARQEITDSTSECRIQNKAFWMLYHENNEKEMNMFGPSGYMAFIQCYSTNDIGILAISTQGWVLCKNMFPIGDHPWGEKTVCPSGDIVAKNLFSFRQRYWL